MADGPPHDGTALSIVVKLPPLPPLAALLLRCIVAGPLPSKELSTRLEPLRLRRSLGGKQSSIADGAIAKTLKGKDRETSSPKLYRRGTLSVPLGFS